MHFILVLFSIQLLILNNVLWLCYVFSRLLYYKQMWKWVNSVGKTIHFYPYISMYLYIRLSIHVAGSGGGICVSCCFQMNRRYFSKRIGMANGLVLCGGTLGVAMMSTLAGTLQYRLDFTYSTLIMGARLGSLEHWATFHFCFFLILCGGICTSLYLSTFAITPRFPLHTRPHSPSLPILIPYVLWALP